MDAGDGSQGLTHTPPQHIARENFTDMRGWTTGKQLLNATLFKI
jgi:hypothetical protein